MAVDMWFENLVRTVVVFVGRCLIVVSPLPAIAQSIDASQSQALVSPLSQAHAHNDYAHARPLLDALEQGFCSIEADIFLVDGSLLVAHEVSELDPARTLEALYLAPLQKIVSANEGAVHLPGVPFQLLIDIKSDGESTYQTLHEVLMKYRGILTEVMDGQVTERAITVVISGNRPIETISNQPLRLAAIDGRLSDLESTAPTHLLPLISDRWSSHFQWNGKGEFPLAEKMKLQEIVRKAHASGRRVRFWATSDNEPMWKVLQAANVDHINTDDLRGLAQYLKKP